VYLALLVLVERIEDVSISGSYPSSTSSEGGQEEDGVVEAEEGR